MIFQEEISLTPFTRGFHLITDQISKVILSSGIQTGTAQVFVLHTSASLSINENTDPSVRLDFESHLNELVPENQAYFQHNYEGSDDMPAHIKASLLGAALSVDIEKMNHRNQPISNRLSPFISSTSTYNINNEKDINS